MPHRPDFSGAGAALITPFQKDGHIDYPALGKVIDHVIAGGIDYLVSLGTTGEAITLNQSERRQVLDFTIHHTDERVPIIAGCFGGNDTRELTSRINGFNFDGLAGLMSSSPSYSKPSQEGLYQHYLRVADASPLPVIIYNVPARTAANTLPETVLRLANTHQNFAAVKEASGRLAQVAEILKYRPEHLAVLSGEDLLTTATVALGGQGGISVVANAFPQHFSRMVTAALADDWPTARQLNFDLLDLHPPLYAEGNPVGIKAAVSMLGLCDNYLRLPLVPLSESGQEVLRKQMFRVPNMTL